MALVQTVRQVSNHCRQVTLPIRWKRADGLRQALQSDSGLNEGVIMTADELMLAAMPLGWKLPVTSGIHDGSI